jgi:hypothetical protein
MKRVRTLYRTCALGLALLVCLALFTPTQVANASPYCQTAHISCGEVTNSSSYNIYVGPLTGGGVGQPAAYYVLRPGQKSTIYLVDADFVAPINTSLFVTWGVNRVQAYPGQFVKIQDWVHLNCVNDSTGGGVWCYAI